MKDATPSITRAYLNIAILLIKRGDPVPLDVEGYLLGRGIDVEGLRNLYDNPSTRN